MKRDEKTLRWGYSTGACAAAAAAAAWLRLTRGEAPRSVRLRFLDGEEREIPLLPSGEGHMAAVRKNGGDDPDCTHGAVLYADLRSCALSEARPEDYVLAVGSGTLILRCVEGVGLCVRRGLDCDQGRWAVNVGPRRMIAENLELAGFDGIRLLELGVKNGAEIAKRTLNASLGVEGGVSILGTTGLVRPYSHDAYVRAVRLRVKALRLSGGSTAVFCTGGRTKSGAEKRLSGLPPEAFVEIGDFLAESLAAASRFGMREIAVACMPGKLCKYAAGFANTHAAKAAQDMDLLRAEVRRVLPGGTPLPDALEGAASVREALLFVPEEAREPLLRNLARAALVQFARRARGGVVLRLLLFDFGGAFLFEERLDASDAAPSSPEAALLPPEEERDEPVADAAAAVGPSYFMEGLSDDA